MNLLNSNYEDWRKENPKANWKEFSFEIKKLGVNINSLNGFIRVYNQSNSRVHEGPEKNTSAGFIKELKDLKSKGKKNTVFREFNDKGKITTEMGFWDEQAKDYRIVNLNSLTTKLLEQEGNKTFPSNFEELLNNMVAAMSVININATSPKASSRIVTNSGIVVKQNSEVYKDILLTLDDKFSLILLVIFSKTSN